MGRVACIDLPALPLQLLVHERPRWRGAPVAVVSEPGPDAPLTHVDERAYRLRVRPGMRQAAARNLLPELRLGVVSPDRVRTELEEVATALQTFSPRVEPEPRFPGIFFVDPRGLSGLYGGLKRWADAVHRFLRGRGLRSTVTIGFERYRTMAVGRTRPGAVRVLDQEAQERELSNAVSLDRLDELPPDLRESLALLGVRTLGDFLALPVGELHSRFGAEASTLHGLFEANPQLPMQPRPFDEPVRVALSIDPPDDNQERLLFAIKGALHELVRGLAVRGEALGALEIMLSLEGGGIHREHIEPSAATRDVLTVVELVRLRLGSVHLPGRIEDVALEATSAAPEAHQLQLAGMAGSGAAGHRDPGAADRALARLRAAWGPASVTRARTRDAHLPEAGFTWEPLERVRLPAEPEEPGRQERMSREPPALVRRVLARPRPLPARSQRDPQAGPTLPEGEGPLRRLYGPYRVSGAWWARRVERDYYYAETGSGSLLWLYYDRPRRRWFLHGTVD